MTCPRSHSAKVAELTTDHRSPVPGHIPGPKPCSRTSLLLWGPRLLDLPVLPQTPSPEPLPPSLAFLAPSSA